MSRSGLGCVITCFHAARSFATENGAVLTTSPFPLIATELRTWLYVSNVAEAELADRSSPALPPTSVLGSAARGIPELCHLAGSGRGSYWTVLVSKGVG